MTQQAASAPEGLVGSVLLGRFRVVRELARGGMGVVYLARVEGAVGFVKPVVIKVLLPEHTEDAHMVGLFAREARILSQLRHPSLVDVIEFGEQDGGYVLVLEYVRGYHMGLWLRYLTLTRRDVPVQIVLQLVIDVLEALHHAHTQRHPDGSPMHIVHRDVSPSNVLLDETGRARLLDFGVARMRGGSTHDYRTQVQGGFMGKLPYTAPEVFSGSEASPQSDLYACAVVLYEALSGQNPFRAETQAATLQRVLQHVPDSLESRLIDAPPGLDRVLARALAKPPAARHLHAQQFAEDLRRLQSSPESEIRAELAELLKHDFGAEMSQLLKLESLADRDVAWRNFKGPARDQLGFTHTRKSAAQASSEDTAHLSETPGPMTASTLAPGRGGLRQTGRRSPEQPLTDEPLTMPLPAADVTQSSLRAASAMADSVANTNADVRDDAESLGHPSAGPTARRRTKPVTQAPPTPSAHPVRPARSKLLLWATVLVGVAAASATAGLLLRRPNPVSDVTNSAAGHIAAVVTRAPEQPATEVATVTPQTQVPDEQPEPVVPVEPTPQQPLNDLTQPIAGNTRKANGDKPRTQLPPKPRNGSPDAAALTRALRKQQPQLEACFKEYSLALEGQPITQLEFDLAQDGTLMRVELSPRRLGSTSLGQCLLKVARSTPFPPQPRAISFTIPLTASRGG